MSQRTMEAHYRPNWNLTQAAGLIGYNCGYAESPGCEPFGEHQRALVFRLLGDTHIGPDTTILDVGCGIGGPTGWIHERYNPRRVIGLEYLASSTCAAEDRWRDKDARPFFIQGDAHHLPVADESVDVVFNLESALHYADKNAFLAECRRVLKPGGTLCLGDITTNKKLLFAPIAWLNLLPSQFNSNIHLWSCDDYLAAFGRHGLTLLRSERAAQPVADSLADGLEEIKQMDRAATRGFRGRILFLDFLKSLFRSGKLAYDLFTARRK